MFKAGQQAGFSVIEYKPQYSDPEHRQNPVMKRYLEELDATDYLMKFRFFKL